MKPDEHLFELRRFALQMAQDMGVRLSHRPPGAKLEEGSVELLPDQESVPIGDLKVGDCVSIVPELLVPWQVTPRYDLHKHGIPFGQTYEWRQSDEVPWVSEVFKILCFATATTRIRSQRPHLKGIFAVLAIWVRKPHQGLSPGFSGFFPFGNYGVGGPVPLHWIGCLRRTDQPVA